MQTSASNSINLPTAINPKVLRDAADWFARLNDNELNHQTEKDWRAWLAASPEHQQAWERVEAIDSRIRTLDSTPAKTALNTPISNRRQLVKTLILAGVGLPLASRMGWQLSQPWRADYATTVGEIRQLRLADGTELWLNTDSAVNINYSAQARHIELLQGEITLRTSHHMGIRSSGDPRPLHVSTSLGYIQPLGTWFTVRQGQGDITVSVYGGRVAVKPAQTDRQQIIETGYRARFTLDNVTPPSAMPDTRPNWTRGILVTEGMPLVEVIDELGRYRHGHLSVTDDVANLRIIGAFPLQDTDSVLAALEQSLPIKVVRLSPWWVRVQPAD